MAARKSFGTLHMQTMHLEDSIGRGENPNGQVTQTANGTHVNANGADGDDWTWGTPASGPRWNKTEPDGKMEDRAVPRPIAGLVPRRR